jgi:hypothetical protein
MTWYTVWTPNCPKHHSSKPSSVSRSFELFQLASVQTFQQHVWTTLSVWLATGFLSKTQIWKDRYKPPDDVDSYLDALIHKASIAFKIQTSGLQSSWSGSASYLYGNCVIWSTVWTTIPLVRTRETLIWKLRAAEVRPSGRQGNTVRTRLKTRKNFSEILESRLHSCPSGRLMSTVRTVPRFIKPDAHLNLQPINRGP